MKKLSAALIAGLTVSLSTFAAVPTGAAPFQVVVPNLKSGLAFTLEGLYLQPTNSDLDYGTLLSPPGANPTTADVKTVDPDYDIGFRIGLGYVFPNSGNDVQLNWTHFDHSSDDAASFVGAGSTGQPHPTVITRGGNVMPAWVDETGTATSNVSVNYDAVDLDVGQYMSVGTRLQTRLFAGLRYAYIKQNITDFYSDISTSGTVFNLETDTFNSKFTGIGPRLGIDTAYHVGNCFGVVGHIAAALLVGRVETTSGVNASGLDITNAVVSVTTDNQTRVAPAFDAKLGVDYSWPIRNDAQRFTIEAGYQVTQYIDAIDRLYVNVTNGNTVTRTTSGVGFNGPYLSLSYKM